MATRFLRNAFLFFSSRSYVTSFVPREMCIETFIEKRFFPRLVHYAALQTLIDSLLTQLQTRLQYLLTQSRLTAPTL